MEKEKDNKSVSIIQKKKLFLIPFAIFLICYPILFFSKQFPLVILMRVLYLDLFTICSSTILFFLIMLFLESDINNGIELSKRFKNKKFAEKSLIINTFKNCFCITSISMLLMALPPTMALEDIDGIILFFRVATFLLGLILFGTTLASELETIRLFFFDNPICPKCGEFSKISANYIDEKEPIGSRNQDGGLQEYFYRILYEYKCPECNYEWKKQEEFSTKRSMTIERTNENIIVWKFVLEEK